ncbi:MAG: AmmeMemoRadiSam system protein B [Pseudomonadales bacterium]|nr:AmmeMemoRadiSam system protein B [Pseudomonadales bacterium]
MSIRQAAVAGLFYPAQATELQHDISDLFLQSESLSATEKVGKTPAPQTPPCALIVPHAGYCYSGIIAACAYSQLKPWAKNIHKVAILGPSHRVALQGMALSKATFFQTPLGDIAIDVKTQDTLMQLCSSLQYQDQAHAYEHSLEVHLPFLQQLLADFSLIPIVVGDCEAEAVKLVIQTLWKEKILVIISSDLSHFLAYESANKKDKNTITHILQMHHTLHGEQACGCRPINGLLLAAEEQQIKINLLAYANSGDSKLDNQINNADTAMAERKKQVVGYGAFSLYQ